MFLVPIRHPGITMNRFFDGVDVGDDAVVGQRSDE